MAVAYSYLRFSSPQQAAGDSVRRQVEKTAEWCRRNKVELDNSMSLRDEGVSAFKGKHRENPDTHALAAFVNAVRSGRVPAGSYLVVESLDRLSREKIRPALTLLLNLIEAGVKVVQLMPVEVVYDEDVEPMQLLVAVMELNRGHSESAVKSARVGAAWARKRAEAATKVVTRKLPGWVRYDNGKLVLDAAGAATVRRVFDMAVAGNGVQSIARTLNAEGAPVLGRKAFRGRPVVWSETVVYTILTSRATYGEFQPSKGRGADRAPVGDPIEGYYPPAIDRETFLRAQSAMKSRTKRGSGRRGKHVNLFAGMLRDARDGGSFTYKHVTGRASVIIPVNAKQGRGTPWTSFPAPAFERALRSKLSQVKASEIAGENAAARKLEALGARKAELEELLAAWEAQMDNPLTVDRVAANLARWSGELAAVNAEIAEAQREAANPLSEAWGEARTLAGMDPDDDTEELRLRIRAALRRSIETVTCLFNEGSMGGAKMTRLAAVRVDFRGGAHRDYLIRVYTRNGTRRDGRLDVLSFAESGVGDGIDIRREADRNLVEKMLTALGIPKAKPAAG